LKSSLTTTQQIHVEALGLQGGEQRPHFVVFLLAPLGVIPKRAFSGRPVRDVLDDGGTVSMPRCRAAR